ncbi:hypothetical protein [Ureibacillus chungkukjangi]|uniref:hypothetical protein n=1 Tax=Ureibacillus chungkukjangi TaxID=1202712 RepID=UPI000D370669|nr:hypothetical protein [Ureibacillus chungkukjangi]
MNHEQLLSKSYLDLLELMDDLITMHQKNKAWRQRFLSEITPLLEQLTLYHDYYDIRCETFEKNSDCYIQLLEILKSTKIIANELLQGSAQRVEILKELDYHNPNINLSKNKLLYLADHAPTTIDLYELLVSKLLRNPALFRVNAEETYKELADCLEHSLLFINAVHSNPSNTDLANYLMNTLLEFYRDLKELVDGMRGRSMMIM